jgi:hypothetical protein
MSNQQNAPFPGTKEYPLSYVPLPDEIEAYFRENLGDIVGFFDASKQHAIENGESEKDAEKIAIVSVISRSLAVYSGLLQPKVVEILKSRGIHLEDVHTGAPL